MLCRKERTPIIPALEAEAGRSQVRSQPALHKEILSQKKQPKQNQPNKNLMLTKMWGKRYPCTLQVEDR
jgi:hypothetical protein